MSTSKDAVQPDAWYKALPRAIYAGLEQVPTSEPWFSVYKIAPNIYAFYEDGHFQEVISYLVIGSEKAMLVDSGMGIGNIKKAVEDLYDGEVFVLNTHSHFDHTGCDWMFEKVYIFNHPSAIYRLQNGLPHENVYPSLHGDSVVKPYPDGFDPETYVIKPTAFETIEDGAVFDLGGSVWHVMHTPGHTPGCVCYVLGNVIFTGDLVMGPGWPGRTDLPGGNDEDMEASLARVMPLRGEYRLLGGHG